jgi:hypothetical protein
VWEEGEKMSKITEKHRIKKKQKELNKRFYSIRKRN